MSVTSIIYVQSNITIFCFPRWIMNTIFGWRAIPDGWMARCSYRTRCNLLELRMNSVAAYVQFQTCLAAFALFLVMVRLVEGPTFPMQTNTLSHQKQREVLKSIWNHAVHFRFYICSFLAQGSSVHIHLLDLHPQTHIRILASRATPSQTK